MTLGYWVVALFETNLIKQKKHYFCKICKCKLAGAIGETCSLDVLQVQSNELGIAGCSQSNLKILKKKSVSHLSVLFLFF